MNHLRWLSACLAFLLLADALSAARVFAPRGESRQFKAFAESAAESSSDSSYDESSTIAATPLDSRNSGCNSGGCAGNAIVWADAGRSSSSRTAVTGSGDSDLSSAIGDVLQPIADWIKDFKQRTSGGDDVESTARATVAPLLEKLRKNQKEAEEQLIDSNARILKAVEDATVSHITQLLKAEKKKDDKEEEAERKLEKLQEKRDEASEREIASSESTSLSSSSSSSSKSASKSASSSSSKSGSSSK